MKNLKFVEAEQSLTKCSLKQPVAVEFERDSSSMMSSVLIERFSLGSLCCHFVHRIECIVRLFESDCLKIKLHIVEVCSANVTKSL